MLVHLWFYHKDMETKWVELNPNTVLEVRSYIFGGDVVAYTIVTQKYEYIVTAESYKRLRDEFDHHDKQLERIADALEIIEELIDGETKHEH